ncbi:MAG: ACT domain-containing protein [Peptococcaceae bacterium]|jgi:ACT domain-containing protein|nr:ACT domain-containing protein [Peptococcaceae bacterium]
MEAQKNRMIITVLGNDQIGIIAWIANRLAEFNVNILDISQTILQEFFTMIMIVDLSPSKTAAANLGKILAEEGKQRGLQVNIQHEDVFAYMHRI